MASPWDCARSVQVGTRSRDNARPVSQSDRRLGNLYDQGAEGEADALPAVAGGSGLHDESGGGRYLVDFLKDGGFVLRVSVMVDVFDLFRKMIPKFQTI